MLTVSVAFGASFVSRIDIGSTLNRPRGENATRMINSRGVVPSPVSYPTMIPSARGNRRLSTAIV